MAKPDDRSDNAEKLQEMASNTEENLQEAEDYLDEHADEISATELHDIESKNERREQSIDAFLDEAEDEEEYQQSNE
jgi:small acid-soluble spore protein (thioredoxin-like protein)